MVSPAEDTLAEDETCAILIWIDFLPGYFVLDFLSISIFLSVLMLSMIYCVFSLFTLNYMKPTLLFMLVTFEKCYCMTLRDVTGDDFLIWA